jgi:hypothetical protein
MLTNWSITKTRISKFRDLRAEEKMGKFQHLTKRDVEILKRKLSTLQRYLGGIKYMTRLPDIVIVLEAKRVYSSSGMCHYGDSYYFFSQHKLRSRSHEYIDSSQQLYYGFRTIFSIGFS